MRKPPGERSTTSRCLPSWLPLTSRRNTQIQMYWLWKWLESYNNCTFSTWKDTFYSICYFGSIIRFAHFMVMLREELPSLPPLMARHRFLIIQIFEQLSCSEKQRWHETFQCSNIFYLPGLLSNLWLALKNRVCPEFTVFNIYIFNHSEFWTTCACPEKQSLPWKFSLHWNIFICQDFWRTCACPENRVYHEIFRCS